MRERDGLVYQMFNDDTGEHVADIFYNSKCDRYSAKLSKKGIDAPIIFGKFSRDFTRFYTGVITEPDSRNVAIFLQDRVIPPNRDGIKRALESFGIYEYDWKLLIRLNHGRSVNDPFRVEAMQELIP